MAITVGHFGNIISYVTIYIRLANPWRITARPWQRHTACACLSRAALLSTSTAQLLLLSASVANFACAANSARTAHTARTAHSARTARTAHSARTAHISCSAHTAHPEISHTLTP